MSFESASGDVVDFHSVHAAKSNRNAFPRDRASRYLKRSVDLLLAIPGVIFLLPVLAIIAVVVKMNDGGPVLFAHTRRGQDGKAFKCLKFRSMAVDAQERLAALLASDSRLAAEWAARQKLDNDPRVTSVGNFLRKTSLDELPQLLNIIRGDMSVVGPRPIVDDEVIRYGDHIRAYDAYRPGIFGLWQISGRSETTYDERVDMDVEYARRQSFWLDLKIMVLGIPAVLLSRGAV
ncbi:MAG: sugar transferase [Pseudomonadota bacterium]